MGYVDSHLLPNESVTFRTHLHWIIYARTVFVAVPAVALIVAGTALQDKAVAGIGLFILLIAAIMVVGQWFTVKTSEFAVTNKRVVIKSGMIRRISLELLLRQVEVVGVSQSITGRIFGYGIITIGGTGGTKEEFRAIARPMEFRRQVHIQTESDRTGT
jgi:uncharacterized membrane protein YdbT with pleckstrin-like domain